MARKVKYNSVEEMPLLGGFDENGVKILPVYKNDKFHKVIYEIYKKQESVPWTVEEIKFTSDLTDWKKNLSEQEKNVISMILSLFTGSDAAAVLGYAYLMRVFKPVCFTMLYAKIAAVEALHVDAYSTVTDTLGFDASYYKQLNEIEESKEFVPLFLNSRVKGFDFYLVEASKKLSNLDLTDEENILYLESIDKEVKVEADRLFKIALAKFIIVYGVLLESIHLFGLFAVLFSFRQIGKMKGLGTTVEWSVRDEYIHYNTNLIAYNTLLDSYPEVFTPAVRSGLTRWTANSIDTLHKMEYKFLDKVFEQGDIPSLKLVDAKGYIDYIVNDRKKLLGITYEKGIENPLPFMDSILANNNLTNFFSDTVTDYERNATDGDWESVRANLVDVRRAILGA